MKQVAKAVAVLSMVALFATSAIAVEGGNPKKGKYAYRQNCKVCHAEGGEGGNLTPMSKTRLQWDRFFEKDKHKAKEGVIEGISEGDLLNLWQFLYDHASDSPTPQTCG